MHTPIRKVLVYVIADEHVLVHTHVDFPEAGVQVPGGTIEEGESAIEAGRRELYEESGLKISSDIVLIHCLDFVAPWDGRLHKRHFVALGPSGITRAPFRHTVTSGIEDEGIRLDYYWLTIAEALENLGSGHEAGIAFLSEFNFTGLP